MERGRRNKGREKGEKRRRGVRERKVGEGVWKGKGEGIFQV